MDDDFNTADALAAFFTLARDAHKTLGPDSPRSLVERTLEFFLELGEPLRLFRAYREGSRRAPAAAASEAEQLLELLIEVREYARSIRDYELADRIRDRLAALGYRLEDTPAGTRVRRMASASPATGD